AFALRSIVSSARAVPRSSSFPNRNLSTQPRTALSGPRSSCEIVASESSSKRSAAAASALAARESATRSLRAASVRLRAASTQLSRNATPSSPRTDATPPFSSRARTIHRIDNPIATTAGAHLTHCARFIVTSYLLRPAACFPAPRDLTGLVGGAGRHSEYQAGAARGRRNYARVQLRLPSDTAHVTRERARWDHHTCRARGPYRTPNVTCRMRRERCAS